ncbi:antiviral reverse transcriptase Drt3b [Thalassospira sp. MCCC 1A01428]|uniref:antiviral reverse transcriptase Drt3b n=1 Tax=Thalassospira sp. MCCC 1A01428 TaxID=1470575 RepID=UPI000A1E13E2|nr:antiviral reverse transcriptase Drt3b [Thalassospira sp. MCCC 1A01428]OSQ44466.1 hypothetical protein THS27_07310 [Thalassospira sp. MCCC 1A01428]
MKKIISVKKDDWYRVLLSETSPADIPIIISNDGFYLNMKSKNPPKLLKEIIDRIIVPPLKKQYTVPLTYKIIKNQHSLRKLSLPHPKSQIEAVEFYKKYHFLILHYCNQGSFSIRYPEKLASHYFLPGRNQDIFAYKSQEVTTSDVDNIAKHAVSIFTYSKYRRLHHFFSSSTYTNLERKYKYMASLDVSKCFDSIYTHSISWAVKSKREAKNNTKANTFGGHFDELMQKMNYNETNGIIIGPEISRIFSEIILSKIDKNIENELIEKEIKPGEDYNICRYVDNFYVFYNEIEKIGIIEDEIKEGLDFFKMHLNDSKKESIARPFFTKKSMAISEATSICENYFESHLKKITQKNSTIYYISPGYNLNFKNFSLALRRACHLADSDYESISSFLIAALKIRIQKLSSSQDEIIKKIHTEEYKNLELEKESYIENLSNYLVAAIEMCMHIYTLSPSVASSMDAAIILIITSQILKKHNPDHFKHAREKVQMWLSRLIESPSIKTITSNEHATQIEILNIFCALDAFFDGEHNLKKFLIGNLQDRKKTSYFEIIVTLFIIKDEEKPFTTIKKTLKIAQEKILKDVDLSISSEATHLFLDILSCPHIEKDDRRIFYKKIIEDFNDKMNKVNSKGATIPVAKTNIEIDETLTYMEENPWFVNWKEINLIRLIEKKRLLSGYH